MEGYGRDEVNKAAFSILAYLARHPGAKDGLEGIVEWWILEQRIVDQTTVVRAALKTLVETGWLVAEKGADKGPMYGINPQKAEEIRDLVKTSVSYAGVDTAGL